jgi:predicted nucleotidyltransferase component of viral defense system
MITAEQLRSLAGKYQIDQYSILREYLQLLFLKYFYESKESQKIYFKGGTAIHFLFGSFRFSEDLDFTSLLPASGIRILLGKIMGKLETEVAGLELHTSGVKEHALTAVVKYRPGLKYPLTIRLEFSLREKPLTHAVSPIETLFPVGAYPLVVHLDSEELLAEKVRAILTRHKGRDLFDFWFLLSKGVKINNNYVQNKMDWYKIRYDYANLLAAIGKYSAKTIGKDLEKFLPGNYRPFLKELKRKIMEKLGQSVPIKPGVSP